MAQPEFGLIAAIREVLAPPGADVSLGSGDDAAVVAVGDAEVALTIDALTDGVHFDRSVSSAADVGWKLVAVNVSDLAAIGARPRAGVVALHITGDVEDAWVLELHRGMQSAATEWSLDIVGGDVVTSPTLALSLALVGSLEGRSPMRRADARVGDAVVLVGEVGLGSAFLALERAGREDVVAQYPELVAHHRRPVPHLDAGIVLAQTGARACIDVSDGIGRDAASVARASGVRLVLNESAIPLHDGVAHAQRELGDDLLAISGGEDFALLATVDPAAIDGVRRALARIGETVSVIGTVEDGDGVTLVRADGRRVGIETLGYEHGTTSRGADV